MAKNHPAHIPKKKCDISSERFAVITAAAPQTALRNSNNSTKFR
jgi:hypothetical protein